jgi:hypothetical protein
LFRRHGEVAVLEEDPRDGEIIARVAGLDIGKAEVVCCVRVPHEDKLGRRLQEVVTYSTMTRRLLAMSDHLRCSGVTRIIGSRCSICWRLRGSIRGWSTRGM